MRGRSVSERLGLPVRVHGIQVGQVVDALLDMSVDRVLGLEVLCGDGARRFLPFAVSELRPEEVALDTALTLIDERDLAYYRRHSRPLSETGWSDPWLDDDGSVHEALSAA